MKGPHDCKTAEMTGGSDTSTYITTTDGMATLQTIASTTTTATTTTIPGDYHESFVADSVITGMGCIRSGQGVHMGRIGHDKTAPANNNHNPNNNNNNEQQEEPHQTTIATATSSTTPANNAILLENEDFEWIDEVEWGPSRDDSEYDTDQELAPRPRRQPVDVCACVPPPRILNGAAGGGNDTNEPLVNSDTDLWGDEEDNDDDNDVDNNNNSNISSKNPLLLSSPPTPAASLPSSTVTYTVGWTGRKRKNRESISPLSFGGGGPQYYSATEEGVCCLNDNCILYACREECSSRCPAGMACGNRRLQRKQFPTTEVFDAGSKKGRGLRILQSCRRGDILCEYTGRAQRAKHLNALFRRYQWDRRLYILALGDGVYLDARRKGGKARFINHSCQPNCKMERWKVRGILRAAVVALRDISAGEELTFDYQWERKRGRAPTVCHCGSPQCRGTLEMLKSVEETAAEKELEGHWQIGSSLMMDQTLVNSVVKIFSTEHQEYFWGEVTGFDHEQRKHCILYRHDMTEVWEDLSKEQWMVLDDTVEKEQFIIAKKVQQRDSSRSLLVLDSSADPALVLKHYLYVQTPVKEALWARHLIERCERNCGVHITAQQMARPPLPVNIHDPEDVEKYRALDQSKDGTVWKIFITGSDVSRAHEILTKNVTYLDKKMTDWDGAAMAGAGQPLLSQSELQLQQMPQQSQSSTIPLAQTTTALTITDEIIFPRTIVDHVKRKLPTIREKCRNVHIAFAPSESKSKQFSRLVLEGGLNSDIHSAKEFLWSILVALCHEANAPMAPNKIHRHLGFLGGELSSDEFRLLRGEPKARAMAVNAQEDLNGSPFINSFESSYHCTVWIQAEEDRGRIDSRNLIRIPTPNASRKVYFGCQPSNVQVLWGHIKARVNDLARGVKYFYLGTDRIFQPAMVKEHFFDFVYQITGAQVLVDNMTGDHLRIDGKGSKELENNHFSDVDCAELAEEIIRLQIECYRDNALRHHPWIFGRDWAGFNLPTSSPNDSEPRAVGYLDASSAAQGCMDIAEIVADLKLPGSVAAHACIILYRFVAVSAGREMVIKQRDALLACVFLANKAHKAKKWHRLEAILSAGYRTIYRGANFDPNAEEAYVLEEKVIQAEKEIIEALQYDVFWHSIYWIKVAVSKVASLNKSTLKNIFSFAFSGQVLSSGLELWLRYGIEYIFAASAAFLEVNLEGILSAMALTPLKVDQAAQLLVDSVKIGSPLSKVCPSHPLLERGRQELEQHLDRVKSECINALKNRVAGVTHGQLVIAGSEKLQRYQLIALSRERRRLRGIGADDIDGKVLPSLLSAIAESGCLVYLSTDRVTRTTDLILDGNWKSVSIAEHQLKKVISPGSRTAYSAANDPDDGSDQPQVRTQPGLVNANAISVLNGWGTPNESLGHLPENHGKIGGKACIPADVPESSLREAGLRWWAACSRPLGISGSLSRTYVRQQVNGDSFAAFAALAETLVGGDSASFPRISALAKRAGAPIPSSNKAQVSLQRWPPEKVETKESRLASKGSKMRQGYSASALQEMQLLTQLHGLIPSPQGHPNLILPVGVAVAKLGVVDETTKSDIDSKESKGTTFDDPSVLSLFKSNVDKDLATETNKKIRESPHLVHEPTPFVLQRFISRRIRDSEDAGMTPVILTSWCHDMLSALVHCHSSNLVVRVIQPDQIVVDHSGVVKFGSLYRSKFLEDDELKNPKSWLELARSAKESGKRDTPEIEFNPFVAPEILLGFPKYRPASDVWAVGCLVASLMVNRPLFSGKDPDALLTAQYKLVGTPAKDNFEDAARFPKYRKPQKKYAPGVERALQHMLKDRGDGYGEIIRLVEAMIHLDPRERCTAVQALNHECMANFRERRNTDTFREQYAKAWLSLKRRMMQLDGDESATERKLKRKAMIAAASSSHDAQDQSDDELYDMDDLMDVSMKKTKS